MPVLSREIFNDPTGNAAKAAMALGLAHRKLKFTVPNETPLGTVITAPPPEQHELFCRNGLKHHAWISGKNIRTTLKEIEKQRAVLRRAKPSSKAGKFYCMNWIWPRAWPHSHAGSCFGSRRGRREKFPRRNAWPEAGIRELQKLEKDFNAYWPTRNKATPQHCSAFLKWRIGDYRRSPGLSLVSSELARGVIK